MEASLAAAVVALAAALEEEGVSAEVEAMEEEGEVSVEAAQAQEAVPVSADRVGSLCCIAKVDV